MVLYDIFLEEFIKNFHPEYKEDGLKTLCLSGGKEVLIKNEETAEISWSQEYPPQVKEFILKSIKPLLKPKFIKAKYLIKENQILTSYQEVLEVEIASSDPLMEILLYLEVSEVEGELVRRFNGPYRFYPRINAPLNGWTKEACLKAVGEAIQKITPEVVVKLE